MTIRRTLLAALWGMPGPLIAGCLIALAFPLFEEGVPQDARGWLRPIGKAARVCWIPLGEAIAGGLYGLKRHSVSPNERGWRGLSLRQGMAIGAGVWALLGLVPFLLLFAVAAGRGFGSDKFFDILGAAITTYALHIFGGAVAGFHVDHYLLRAGNAKVERDEPG